MAHPLTDTRAALLEAALECFALHGFEGTSIRMIADKAGRPLSLISHHFGGKEGLYVEVFRLLLGDFDGRFRGYGGLQVGAPRTREEAIGLLRALISFLYADSAIKRRNRDPLMEWGSILWLHEFRAPRPALNELIRAYVSPLVDKLKTAIAVLQPGLTPSESRFVGITILGMIHGHATMFGMNEVIWGVDDRFCELEEDSDRLLNICLHGIEGFVSKGEAGAR